MEINSQPIEFIEKEFFELRKNIKAHLETILKDKTIIGLLGLEAAPLVDDSNFLEISNTILYKYDKRALSSHSFNFGVFPAMVDRANAFKAKIDKYYCTQVKENLDKTKFPEVEVITCSSSSEELPSYPFVPSFSDLSVILPGSSIPIYPNITTHGEEESVSSSVEESSHALPQSHVSVDTASNPYLNFGEIVHPNLPQVEESIQSTGQHVQNIDKTKSSFQTQKPFTSKLPPLEPYKKPTHILPHRGDFPYDPEVKDVDVVHPTVLPDANKETSLYQSVKGHPDVATNVEKESKSESMAQRFLKDNQGKQKPLLIKPLPTNKTVRRMKKPIDTFPDLG